MPSVAEDAAVGDIRRGIAQYYEAKIRRHGATPFGVDWECAPTQELRFVQLLRICDFTRPFSLTDLGCGYGALLPFIQSRIPEAKFTYVGIDVAPGMISRARRLHRSRLNAQFRLGVAGSGATDYCLASGIFNVKLDFAHAAWERFIEATLIEMSRACVRGFAFNLMAALPGRPSRAELYRCTPERWAGFCEEIGAGRVEILDRYGMREFTLLVRKPA